MEKKSQKKIDELLGLLKMERQEDISIYNQKILEVNLTDRARRGTSLYPLELKESGYGIGAQPFVVLERTKDEGRSHQFSPGKIVNFFTNQSAVNEPNVKGIVNYVSKGIIKVFLYQSDLPDWVDLGKLGLDLLFDDRSYNEMEKALRLTMAAERNKLEHFREIFKGDKACEFEKSKKPSYSNMLNDSQNEAVDKILRAEDASIVHGPPGTGKTTTIVEAIRLLAAKGDKVLACAPSNTAVDWITLKLSIAGLNVIRIGNISRVDEDIIQHTLEHRLYNSPEAKEIKKMKRQAEDCRKMARKFKRKFGSTQREQRRELFKEAREISNQVKMIESYMVDKILTEADVVTATLVGSNNRYVEHRRFDVVVIDEAAQALEPATWIPITKADKKVILAGDPFQLPPTVKSKKAARAGLEKTLIEQSIEKFKHVSLLNVQYRMNEMIMGFSNKRFYNDQLMADPSVKYQTLHLKNGSTQVMEFIDTAGCGFEEKRNPRSRSLFNEGEYQILWKHLDLLLTRFDMSRPPSIGIISPYKEQVLFLKENIKDYFDFVPDIQFDINTIDSFQGQEKDVIYISLVRNNEKGEIGFLKDYRRMNVAMTRARKKLVIIGDSATLANDKFYQEFMDYCELNEFYKSAWEYL